jgi:hypothetical protein
MNDDVRLRLLACQLAVSFSENRPASIDDVIDTTLAFYDFLTADLDAEEEDAAPDNAQVYGGH